MKIRPAKALARP